jgi:hypothetical protein
MGQTFSNAKCSCRPISTSRSRLPAMVLLASGTESSARIGGDNALFQAHQLYIHRSLPSSISNCADQQFYAGFVCSLECQGWPAYLLLRIVPDTHWFFIIGRCCKHSRAHSMGRTIHCERTCSRSNGHKHRHCRHAIVPKSIHQGAKKQRPKRRCTTEVLIGAPITPMSPRVRSYLPPSHLFLRGS